MVTCTSMPSRQALLYARRWQWSLAQHARHRRAVISRGFAEQQTHPIDELVEAQLERPRQAISPLTTEIPSSESAAAKAIREERIEKAKVVFGSRLLDPVARRAELDAGSTRVAGVLVPAKPEEPDNCCMSGCVNCVWDRYREEFEDWAEKTTEAKAAMAKQSTNKATGLGASSVSMDDDGGGSDANWASVVSSDIAADPFADVPVGIREFMKIEKRLRAQHATDAKNE